ncbi:hypothetical protein M8J77_022471 [Diaphorina citri]|nr:hypothetical protein M8J77_022471 [Diaphorina citri]
MSKDRKAGWKCIDCKDVKEKEQNKDKDNRNDQNKEKSKKESKNQERDAFNIEMKTMEENGNKLMDYLNSKFQSLENSIKDQKDDVIKALNLKVKELEEKLEERDQKIADLEDRMDFIENRSRISNVEIRNMPETKNEDVQFLVESIGHTLGISVKEGDIQIAHRVQNRDGSNKNRPIIAHLGSRYIRNKWLKQYKDYKRNFMPLKLLKQVYYALTQSVLEYGIIAFGRADQSTIQNLKRLTSRSPQTPASSHLKSSAPPPPPQPPPTSLPSSHPPNPTSHAPIHASLPHASTAQHPSSGLPHQSNVSHASTLPHGSSGLPHPSTGLQHPSSGIPHTSTLPHGSSGLPHASSGLTHSSTATSQAASHGRMLHSPHDMSPSRGGDNSYSSSVSSLSRSSSGLPPTIRHTPPPVSSQSVSAPPSGGVGVPLSSSLAFSKPPSVSSTPPVWVSTSSGVSSSSPLSSVMRSSPAPSTLSRTPTYLPPMDTPTPVSQPYQATPYLPPGSQAPPTSYGSQAPPTSYAGSQPPTSYGSQVPPTSYPPSQTTPSYIPPSATQTPPTSYLPAVSSQPPYPSVTQTTPSYLGPQATPTSVAPSVQPPPGAPPPPTQPPTNPNPFSAESLFQTNHTDLLRRELDSRFLASSQDVHHHRGAPYSLRTEMHHHQHQHTHVHQHAPLMPPPPGAAALYPPTHLFKDIPKLGAGVDSPFYRHSLALSTYPPGFGLHPGLTPTPTATPFAPPNQYTSFTPKQLTEPPKPKPMKTGKWNAMHVRIAWEIYNHQQKAMAVESKGLKPSLPSASDLLRPPSHLLPSAAPRPPHPYDSPGGPAPPLPPHSAASVLASPFSSLNMFGRYGPSVPTFPPLSSFPSSPLTDPWARLQASRPLPGHPGGYTTPAPPAPTPSAPWSLKPDPVELEREKEREREREREKERIRERERVRREEKQRRLMQQQQAQAAQQKSAAAAAAAVAASQSLHRDRSPLRSDPTASLSGVPGSMLSSKGDDDVMMQMSRGLLSPYLSRVPPVASATGRLGSGVGGVGAHLHPSSRGPYPPPPSPWDPYRYDPLRYNPLMAVAFQREEEERAKLFGAPFAPPAAHHMRSGPPGKVPSPASRLMSGPSPADIKKEETTPAGPGR